jgi:hypothetical protein
VAELCRGALLPTQFFQKIMQASEKERLNIATIRRGVAGPPNLHRAAGRHLWAMAGNILAGVWYSGKRTRRSLVSEVSKGADAV